MTHEYSAPRTGQPDPATLLRPAPRNWFLNPGVSRIPFTTMDTKRGTRTDKREIARKLAKARERTRFLLEGISEEDLAAQHDPIMSP